LIKFLSTLWDHYPSRIGNSYILTIQDLLTKYSVAIPLIEATSLTIANAFTKNFICIYSAPKAILTDQGANFLSSLMRNIIKQFNIKHYKTTAYHPRVMDQLNDRIML